MSTGRKVLVLAHHFPPIGGVGVHRTVGSVRHLPDFGYEPVVVTGPGRSADRWSPGDDALLATIPPQTAVHRIDGHAPAIRTGWAARGERWLGLRPPWITWWVQQAIIEGVRQGRAAGVDLVLTSCVPYETAEAGARVARELGVPWIADLEDPWALDEMRVQPTALHRRKALRDMRRALSSAAAVVMCAPEAAARVRAELPELAERVTSIAIGFEGEDFATPPPPPDRDTFRIVHTGSLHTELGLRHRRSTRARRRLGGTSLDVDILTRSHVFLMRAIDAVLAADPGLAGRVELVLAGSHTAADRAAVAERAYVRVVEQLPHGEVVAIMRSADLLFLPMHDLPPGRRATIIPLKTYEYMAAGPPLLAAVPDGDVRDLLAGVDRATLVRPADVAAMTAAIREHLSRDGDRPAETPATRTLVAGFERRLLVGRIAAVLDGVLATGARPRTVAV